MQEQPTSPHLQIYRPQLTSILSISHRMAGLFLGTSGLVAFTYWIVALAQGPEAYSLAVKIFTTPIVQPVLFMWTVAFFYHFSNGVRHLLWDLGWGFQLNIAYKTGYLVVFNALLLSSVTWAYIYFWK
ncbi:MAG: succinate dehydrogenase, cytochrome b556 subunit [Pseudomonadota bacterium]|nr:succinate dehydrogenase, cytochrome b556 subunit [Pseudomonadota bacterium]